MDGFVLGSFFKIFRLIVWLSVSIEDFIGFFGMWLYELILNVRFLEFESFSKVVV